MPTKTWLITGCSRGFGRALSEVLLERGERVALTARNPDDLQAMMAAHPDNALALKLDVTDPDEVESAVIAARDKFGEIDVLVNNAGYGHMGSVEEAPIEAARAIMETNYFGTLTMIKAVLPRMIKRRSGQIVNIGSVAGQVGFPVLSYYCGSKFALSGMSESLSAELAPLGINVTLVELGAFETGFASSMEIVPAAPHYDLAALTTKAGNGLWTKNDDPVLGSKILIDALGSEFPPWRLTLGEEGLGTITMHEERRQKERARWMDATRLVTADTDQR